MNGSSSSDQSVQSLVERLAKVEHFRSLGQSDLETIVLAGRTQSFSKGSILFFEGEPCAGMFVLLGGRVYLRKGGSAGQDMILAVVEPVIMFNEVAVLDGGPNPVSAVAAEDCLVWRIGYEAFQALLQRLPLIGLSLLRVLARRNRLLLEQYEILTRPVMARLAKLLLELSQQGRIPIDRHAYPLEELANRIATVPEVISRTLNLLRVQGGIAFDRQQITILSAQKLADLARSSDWAVCCYLS